MKTLYIIRHAKSSWSFDLKDFDRPLGERGRKDVTRMGKYLAQHYAAPELIISSPASRAFYTALFIADQWNYPEERIRLASSFYHGSPAGILKELMGLENQNSVAIFGHNPGLTDLANNLSDKYLDNISTCGVVGINFNINNWGQLENSKGNQFIFLKPKDL
ncbi:MAG: histidine phosphatase family protein [Bacteroidota bacterium]